ncbi:MAG: oxygen-independent coproporphyrinogen III oxidase, partial [bacterium]|nr:oxygen-independent coproporphyrinogen III oxidase [bacterium]
YSYAHVPWIKPYQRSFKDSDLPSPEMKLKLFEEAYKTCTKNGYQLIGMDHFARQEDELTQALKERTIHRNFMGYSTRGDDHQIGFGVSAISKVNGNYYQNKKELPDYYEALQQEGQLTTFRGYHLTQDDKIRQDLIQNIMCHGYLHIPSFEKKWTISFRKYFAESLPFLQTFVDDHLMDFTEKEIQVKGEGFLFYRNIAMVFDPYLKGIRENSKTPVFSRTV